MLSTDYFLYICEYVWVFTRQEGNFAVTLRLKSKSNGHSEFVPHSSQFHVYSLQLPVKQVVYTQYWIILLNFWWKIWIQNIPPFTIQRTLITFSICFKHKFVLDYCFNKSVSFMRDVFRYFRFEGSIDKHKSPSVMYDLTPFFACFHSLKISSEDMFRFYRILSNH